MSLNSSVFTLGPSLDAKHIADYQYTRSQRERRFQATKQQTGTWSNLSGREG